MLPVFVRGRGVSARLVPEGRGQHLGSIAAVLVLGRDRHHFVQQAGLERDRAQTQVAELLVTHLQVIMER